MFSTHDTGNIADASLIVGMKTLYLDELSPGPYIGEFKKLFKVEPVKLRDGRMAFLFLVDKDGKLWPTTGRFDAEVFDATPAS